MMEFMIKGRKIRGVYEFLRQYYGKCLLDYILLKIYNINF